MVVKREQSTRKRRSKLESSGSIKVIDMKKNYKIDRQDMDGLPWIEEVLDGVREKRQRMMMIESRKIKLVGHIIRHNSSTTKIF